jgi:hypothetical protein
VSAASKQACFIKTYKYFHLNKNDTGHHKALFLSLTCVRASFAQPQSKYLLLLIAKQPDE